MIYNLDCHNVHEALPRGLNLLRLQGITQDSRNGPVLVSPGPVTTIYQRPWERVIFWPQRDANPFFHLMEGLWMLAGRNDVAFPASYAKQIASYSDDGEMLWGAYGFRWKGYFVHNNGDQLKWAINRLRKDPNDRRVVITMWDPEMDPHKADNGGKDVPCNTQIFLSAWRKTDGGTPILDMQVNCRSNDIIWGAYGANAVHFSMLQEYLAAGIGAKMGFYAQNSWNYHAYTDFMEKMLRRPKEEERSLTLGMARDGRTPNPYDGAINTFPLVSTPLESWDQDLQNFMNGAEASTISDPFFHKVAIPLRDAHASYKEGRFDNARTHLERCDALDWRVAAWEWLKRREAGRAGNDA